MSPLHAPCGPKVAGKLSYRVTWRLTGSRDWLPDCCWRTERYSKLAPHQRCGNNSQADNQCELPFIEKRRLVLLNNRLISIISGRYRWYYHRIITTAIDKNILKRGLAHVRTMLQKTCRLNCRHARSTTTVWHKKMKLNFHKNNIETWNTAHFNLT